MIFGWQLDGNCSISWGSLRVVLIHFSFGFHTRLIMDSWCRKGPQFLRWHSACQPIQLVRCVYIYSKHGKTPSEIVKWIKQLSFLVINHIYINPAKLLVFNPVCSFTFSLFMVRSAGAAPDTPSPTVGLSSRPYISSRTPLWSSEALRLRFLCWKNKKWLYMEGPSISFKGKIISQMVLKIQQVI